MEQFSLILPKFEEQHAGLFGKHLVQIQHRLEDTGLFTDEKLGELIDRCPPEHRSINTMGFDLKNPIWREGTFADVPGIEVIEAIRKGRMWLNIRRLMDYDKDYANLLDTIFSELEGHVPNLETFKRNMTVLISSPKVQVFYHADIQGQCLWQVRGKKRVYIYPATDNFVSPQNIECILLRETEEEMPYQTWYDDYATAVDLEPGTMLHWPLYAPHRVVNHDCLNVSLTTEHWTNEIWRSYATHYGNGVFRRTLGLKRLKTVPNGAHVYFKAGAAFAWKKVKADNAKYVQKTVDFQIDPDNDTGMRDIDPFMISGQNNISKAASQAVFIVCDLPTTNDSVTNFTVVTHRLLQGKFTLSVDRIIQRVQQIVGMQIEWFYRTDDILDRALKETGSRQLYCRRSNS